ncbi:MAG: transglutaminase-like cysteine peptidase [Pseudomonadota bacterium]
MTDMLQRMPAWDPAPHRTQQRVAWFRRIGLAACVAAMALVSMAGSAQGSTRFISDGVQVAAPQGARGLCERYGWACVSGTQTAPSNLLALADYVNRRVNRQVREITDARQYRREEHWALPTARGGDCEDFALLKKRELMRLGVPASRLLMATVLDHQNAAHAVLILRTDQGDFVLDNLAPDLKHWSRTGYTFLRMQDPERPDRWMAVLAGGILAG